MHIFLAVSEGSINLSGGIITDVEIYQRVIKKIENCRAEGNNQCNDYDSEAESVLLSFAVAFSEELCSEDSGTCNGSENSDIENENEFLALVLNKNEVIDLLQIKPEYLVKKENQKMLKYAIECYKEHKVVLPVQIMEKHKEIMKNNLTLEEFLGVII